MSSWPDQITQSKPESLNVWSLWPGVFLCSASRRSREARKTQLLAIGGFDALMLVMAPVRQLWRLSGPVVAAQIRGQIGMQHQPAQTAPGGIRCRMAVATTAAAGPS